MGTSSQSVPTDSSEFVTIIIGERSEEHGSRRIHTVLSDGFRRETPDIGGQSPVRDKQPDVDGRLRQN